MPPGQTIPGNLSFEVARKVLTPEEMQRLACAFLNATDNVNFNAEKAGREFGNVKPDSFKRSIWVITKKIKEASENGEDGETNDTPVKTPVKRGRKRKEDGEDGETPAKKKRTPAKKSKAEKTIDDDEETPGLIKPEPKDDEDEDGHGDLV